MRILLFVSDYPPYGNTSAIHYFAKEWVKSGHEVVVVYDCIRLMFPFYLIAGEKERRFSSGKYEEYTLDDVKVFKIPIVRPIPKLLHISFFSKIQAKRKLTQLLKTQSFDIIVSHFCSRHWYLAELAKKTVGCSLLSVFHTCDLENKKIAKRIIQDSDFIAARSKKIAQSISADLGYKDSIKIIYSGIPSSFIKQLQREQRSDVLSFVYAGRLTKRKRVIDIIEAFGTFPKELNCVFQIIGDGLEKKRLEDRVNELELTDRVFFKGELTREEVEETMRNSDCFVMTSFGETFGLVYLEAMAAGCVVIGSLGEGIDGIIVDGKNGFLVKPGDVTALRNTMIKIMNMDDDSLYAMKREAFNTVLNYTDETIAERYLNFLKDYIQQN